MAKVFHVLNNNDESNLISDGVYRPISLENEKFIHLSKADQILSVIENFYAQNNDELILWRIDEEKLKEHLIYEPPLEAPNSGILFPHYYHSMNTEFIEKKFHLKKNKNGKFQLPENLLE